MGKLESAEELAYCAYPVQLLLAFLGKKNIYFETKGGKPPGTARCGEGVSH
jgi:hypothetical protein